jgi:hypothetical protein
VVKVSSYQPIDPGFEISGFEPYLGHDHVYDTSIGFVPESGPESDLYKLQERVSQSINMFKPTVTRDCVIDGFCNA